MQKKLNLEKGKILLGNKQRNQRYLLKVIEEDLDITQNMVDVINSMKIVLAADKSIRTGKQIKI